VSAVVIESNENTHRGEAELSAFKLASDVACPFSLP
jgi:hypothetical protein